MNNNYVVPSLEQLTVLAGLLNKCDIRVRKVSISNWIEMGQLWDSMDLLQLDRMSEGILLRNGLDIVFYDRKTGNLWEEGVSLGIIRTIIEQRLEDITYHCLLTSEEEASRELRSLLVNIVRNEQLRLERAASKLQLRDDSIDGELGDEKLPDLSQSDEE